MFPCQQLDCLGEGSSIQMGKMKKAVFDSILGKKNKKITTVHLFENVS